MTLELKLKNGKKFVIGGDFTFCVNGNEKLCMAVQYISNNSPKEEER